MTIKSKTLSKKTIGRTSRNKIQHVLGPVENLEEHVQQEWWKNIFNSNYLKTDSDVVNDHDITRLEIDIVIDALGLKESDAILDLCCGHGRHSIELHRRGFYKTEGLDRSHYLISKAREIISKEGLKVKLREGDARKLSFPENSFDAVMMMGNSFGYFETIKDDLQVLCEIQKVLKPGGRLLIDIADGDYLRKNYQPRSWEWISRDQFVCRERSLSSDSQKLISRELIFDTYKGQLVDQFYSERLYSRNLLKNLLSEALFTDIEFKEEIKTQSKKQQDLGMMERRIIVCAEVEKQWPENENIPASRRTKVSVLLGDPNKLDPIKPSLVFDDDDLYTIDAMKKALTELADEYEFEYLDYHDSLISVLNEKRQGKELILNLCDEGFNNDPKKELHIPALLEMLEIPYTGSGPACLAYCYDKSLIRGIAGEMGIPVPNAVFIKPDDNVYEIPLSFPVIIKPNSGDSSFGITESSVAYKPEDLINAVSGIRNKFGYENPLLVEEFLPGKDLTVGVIGNPPESYLVLPVLEEDYSALPSKLPQICGYEAKWLPDSPYSAVRSVPANINKFTREKIEGWILRLFERLDCRDYARFDWRLDSNNEPHLLEVNPNPGWCWDGHMAKMSALSDISYPDMLAAIIKAAEKRLKCGSGGK